MLSPVINQLEQKESKQIQQKPLQTNSEKRKPNKILAVSAQPYEHPMSQQNTVFLMHQQTNEDSAEEDEYDEGPKQDFKKKNFEVIQQMQQKKLQEQALIEEERRKMMKKQEKLK